MGKKKKKERPKMVCFCYGIPEDNVVKAILQEGATTLMDVRRLTNANTGCGGCGEDVKRLLRKYVPKAQELKEKAATAAEEPQENGEEAISSKDGSSGGSVDG